MLTVKFKKTLITFIIVCFSILSIFAVNVDKHSIPTVILTFDDGHHSVYDIAMPYMNKYGFKGTAYIVSDWINDTATYKMTGTQLDELYSKGWAIANHTKDHTDLTKLTEQEIDDELIKCANVLLARGYTRSAYHVAYPYGNVNDTVLTAMKETGMLTGRTLHPEEQTITFVDPRLLTPSLYVFDTTTLKSAKTTLDNAIKNSHPFIVVFHKIVPSLTGNRDEWTTTNFKAFIDYIALKKVRVITIDEFYKELTNTR